MGNRLYVGNLPFSATKDSLREAFAPSGQVTDVQVVTDRETGQSPGFAFVTMGCLAMVKVIAWRGPLLITGSSPRYCGGIS